MYRRYPRRNRFLTKINIKDWEFLYVGSAKDESKDIMIDSFSMGNI